ncbi:MAG: hypothetical protein IJ968_08660 [Clostridia bacterium]|nr:hypothetical protein [Clostridia bacterium]
MKKFIALLMAVLLLMGTASAMTQDMNPPMQMDVSLTVDKDGMKQLLTMSGAFDSSDAPSPEMMDAVLDLISLFSITARSDGENTQMSMNLNQKPILSAQMDMTADGGFAMTTDILPSFALVLDARTMRMINSQMAGMVTGTPEQMQKAGENFMLGLEQLLEKEYAAMNAAVVRSGSTSYTYEGVNFNFVEVKNVAPADAMEAFRKVCIEGVDLLLTFADEAGIALPDAQTLVQFRDEAANANVYEDSYGEATIQITEYKIQEGDGFKADYSYTVFEIGDGYEMVYVSVAQLGKNVDVMLCYGGRSSYNNPLAIMMAANSGAPDACVIDMSFKPGTTAEEMMASVGVMMEGNKMNVVANTQPDGMGGINMKLEYYLMNIKAPVITLNYHLAPFTGDIPAVDISGRQQVNLMDMASGYVDSDLQEALMMDMQNSLSSLLIKAITAAPEQIEVLINEATKMMNQSNY